METKPPTRLGLDLAYRLIDDILPDHTHKGTATGYRFWTTSTGSFQIRHYGRHPDIAFAFVNETDGWDVKVPATGPGLDVLILAMLLSDAIEPYRIPTAEPGHSVVDIVEIPNNGAALLLDRPLDRVPLQPRGAFKLAAILAKVASNAYAYRWPDRPARKPQYASGGGVRGPVVWSVGNGPELIVAEGAGGKITRNPDGTVGHD